MKTNALETLRRVFLCVVMVSLMSIPFVNYAEGCGSEPAWDKDGKFLISQSVGIGIKYPAERLHIKAGDPSMMLDFAITPTNDKAEIVFSNNGNPGARLYWSNTEDKLYLQNLQSGGGGPVMVMDNAGYVGIGIATPGSLLHVAGDVTVDGNIAAKYQDLAEWVKTPEPFTPGTVVMIDPEQENQVIASYQPYSTLVAGVVSETPGIILGEAGENKTKIAHTGRVKVKVDASYGEIEIGDLLVTSPNRGYAMKADLDNLKPGMLLGKALEPLKDGQKGEILVLLTLQ